MILTNKKRNFGAKKLDKIGWKIKTRTLNFFIFALNKEWEKNEASFVAEMTNLELYLVHAKENEKAPQLGRLW